MYAYRPTLKQWSADQSRGLAGRNGELISTCCQLSSEQFGFCGGALVSARVGGRDLQCRAMPVIVVLLRRMQCKRKPGRDPSFGRERRRGWLGHEHFPAARNSALQLA
jgi:hypothetical protein